MPAFLTADKRSVTETAGDQTSAPSLRAVVRLAMIVVVCVVLGYRTISYWLPTLPGVIAYFRLRRGIAGHKDASGRSSPADIRHANGSRANHV